MSSLTLKNGSQMEEKDSPDPSPERDVSPRPQSGGFFSVYKKGQGYWTRMGTALGASLLLLVFAVFIFTQTKTLLASSFYTAQPEENLIGDALVKVRQANALAAANSVKIANNVAVGATAAVVLIGGIFAWRLMNKPKNVDFLVATDVEMKKVNWTSRAELIGATKIVIIFLFVIAALLFLIDVGTGMFFQIIGLLKFGPLS